MTQYIQIIKKPHYHLKECRKVCEKSKHPFMIKALRRTGLEGTHLNIIKTINVKFIANIILNVE